MADAHGLVFREVDQQSACDLLGTPSKVVLGGQRVDIRRLRVPAFDARELPLPSFAWAAQADPLSSATMNAVAAGVSTRRYAWTLVRLAAEEHTSATSSSAVSRRFVQLSQQQLDEWLRRPIEQIDLPVVMIDSIQFRDSLEDTLTLQAMGIGGALYRTLRTTNPIENLNGSVAHYARNVRRWKDASMILRWVTSALSDASGRFRKLRGFAEMRTLLNTLDQHDPGEQIEASRKVA